MNTRVIREPAALPRFAPEQSTGVCSFYGTISQVILDTDEIQHRILLDAEYQ